MPANTVKVDRSTRWGNPFKAGPDYPVAQAVADYRRWLVTGARGLTSNPPPPLAEIRTELAGKNLACWCPEGTPCHADVLLGVANEIVAAII